MEIPPTLFIVGKIICSYEIANLPILGISQGTNTMINNISLSLTFGHISMYKFTVHSLMHLKEYLSGNIPKNEIYAWIEFSYVPLNHSQSDCNYTIVHFHPQRVIIVTEFY